MNRCNTKEHYAPGIKICGLFRECDIDHVNEASPDYAGFIIGFPKSHRNVTPEEALKLRRRLNPQIRAVGVFVDQDPETVAQIARYAELDVIQLHGTEDNTQIEYLRKKTGLPVWKAFKIRSAEALASVSDCTADEVILDSGYGTGTAFDWSLAAKERDSILARGFILAGGLTPENIPRALQLLGPKAVDISSGVETDKVKDRYKILAAVRAVRKMTRQIEAR